MSMAPDGEVKRWSKIKATAIGIWIEDAKKG